MIHIVIYIYIYTNVCAAYDYRCYRYEHRLNDNDADAADYYYYSWFMDITQISAIIGTAISIFFFFLRANKCEVAKALTYARHTNSALIYTNYVLRRDLRVATTE